ASPTRSTRPTARSRSASGRSAEASRLDADVLLARDLDPFADLALHGRGEHVRFATGGIEAELLETVLGRLGGERGIELAVEQLDYWARRARRGEQAEPRQRLVAGNTGFRDRRRVGKNAPALAAADAQELRRIGADEAQRCRTVDRVVDAAGD